MIVFLAIVIIVGLLAWLTSRSEKALSPNGTQKAVVNNRAKQIDDPDNHTEVFTDEDGKQYRLHEIDYELPRKTFVIGKMKGKYWGELDQAKAKETNRLQFYDFNVYEVQVSVKGVDNCSCLTDSKSLCNGLHLNHEGAFSFTPDSDFPRGRLPQQIPCTISFDGNQEEYSVSLHQPQIKGVNFNRKLHQKEGDEVFGTIEADITGFILDFTRHQRIEKVYLNDPIAKERTADVVKATDPHKTGVPTGKQQNRNGYRRTEYFFSDYKKTYWGNWTYLNTQTQGFTEGCLSSGIGIVACIIGAIFLVLLLPRLGILLPFILLPFLLSFVPDRAWTGIGRILSGILVVVFIMSLFNLFSQAASSYVPKPTAQDSPEESVSNYEPIYDTVLNDNRNADSCIGLIRDSLITHYRAWMDYEGNQYSGTFSVKKSALVNAQQFKNRLAVSDATESNYDEVVFQLKQNDLNELGGVYKLFDSIKAAREFTNKGFAEMIVSFVQDIPYSIVLPQSCDPALYQDAFVKRYLADSDALCDGYQKFGLNTPVEFMAKMQGDCDTRTLLLYTILSRYGYDVTLLSSEYYSHSLLGVNLPYEGVALRYNTQRYVLWETTSPNIKPGVLPNEISNTNYWRISLKSK